MQSFMLLSPCEQFWQYSTPGTYTKTLYQVKRRFHWNTWRSDVICDCRTCPEFCDCE